MVTTTSALGRNSHMQDRGVTRRGVLWLGLHCDVRCKFCYDIHLAKANKSWLSFDQAATALQKFRFYYQNTAVDFMGGEPTLHPQILEIVEHAATIGLRPTVITHGMHLASMERAEAYQKAGIHDFLVSIHGIGETIRTIHGRGKDNFNRQMRALDNLRNLGVSFRFNVTMIRDNAAQLEAIVDLAGEKGAKVVNFLTFNPYFEWSDSIDIDFQVRHSEVAPFLARAIDKCSELGIEANVRYMPACQLRGHEAHVYTGYQLPYDQHEWDYNSWYDAGYAGMPSTAWYLEASQRQQQRYGYVHVAACGDCALRAVCDGLHPQYVARWGGDEVVPFKGQPITDPCHFVKIQRKAECEQSSVPFQTEEAMRTSSPLQLTQFQAAANHRAGIRQDGGD